MNDADFTRLSSDGWQGIGIDAVQEYIDMSEQRLLHVTQEMERGAA